MKTDNYLLKEIESSDISNVFKGLSNRKVTRHYAVHFDSLAETEEQMAWYQNLREEDTGIWWGIFDRFDQFCGAAGFNDWDKTNRKAEIGLWLLEECWGRGILKEVMPRLFQYGFKKLDLNRIEGFVDHDNEKCKRALEKIEFTYEGTMREYEIKNGEKIDLDVYAILKKDWNPKQIDKS